MQRNRELHPYGDEHNQSLRHGQLTFSFDHSDHRTTQGVHHEGSIRGMRVY